MSNRIGIARAVTPLILFLVVSRALAASPPAPPVITEPGTDGRIVSAADVHMETGPMSDPDPGDVHASSDWEIWSATPSERVWHADATSGVELVHVHLGDGDFTGSHTGRRDLVPDRDYILQARHRDSTGLVSGWSQRTFRTAPITEVLPLLLDDVALSPAPAWRDRFGAPIVLPGGAPPARLTLDTAEGALLLSVSGLEGTGSDVVNPLPLAAHGAARVRVMGGAAGMALPSTELTFTDGGGSDRVLYLPPLALAPADTAWFWISNNGSSYLGAGSQAEPDFSTLAEGAPVPWNVLQPGYKVEVVATGFQLPVNIAFVPSPGPDPDDPFFYVTELYGNVKVVTRDGSVGDYATGLLNFDPTGEFPGSGEQGVSGIVVDPASGDVFVSLLYDAAPPSGPHYPRVMRLHSVDGGRTAAARFIVKSMPGETQGQSHFISNLSIGPDGKLYVHMGDGMQAFTALSLTSYRGKVLRMNLNGSAPADNPFYNAADGITATDYIFAYGFRNPFGGAWREADAKLYEVENGPDVNDRFARVDAGMSYGWNGSAASMTTRALYNWTPTVAPVNIAFVQPGTWGGSGFPALKQGHAFVTESGPTYASGPQGNGKRVSEFTLAPDGTVVSGPLPLIEYGGAGRATAAAIAAGPDGLYFSDLYRDLDAATPIDPGANILRVRFTGTAEFAADVTRGTAPLTVHFSDLSSVPSPVAWHWEFGDGATSSDQNPVHTYAVDGLMNVRLTVTGAGGAAVEQKNAYVIVGETLPGLSADYYDDPAFSGARLVRVDPGVDFDWGGGSPDPSMGADDFSVRWQGQVRPEFTQTYTFITTTDDGVRLWVDDSLLVNSWVDQAPTQHAGSIALAAGVPVNLRMEFYERGGGAMARLEWQSASRPRQVIPASRLSSNYPAHTGVAAAGDPVPGPGRLALGAVTPTPFTRNASVAFTLARSGPARLAVYDVTGREVRVLFDGAADASRIHTLRLDGVGLPAGVWFLRLTSGGESITRRTVILR